MLPLLLLLLDRQVAPAVEEKPPAQAGGFFRSEALSGKPPSVSAKSLADNALMCHTADCGKTSQSVRYVSTTEF